jgi:hypothetical protein
MTQTYIHNLYINYIYNFEVFELQRRRSETKSRDECSPVHCGYSETAASFQLLVHCVLSSQKQISLLLGLRNYSHALSVSPLVRCLSNLILVHLPISY